MHWLMPFPLYLIMNNKNIAISLITHTGVAVNQNACMQQQQLTLHRYNNLAQLVRQLHIL